MAGGATPAGTEIRRKKREVERLREKMRILDGEGQAHVSPPRAARKAGAGGAGKAAQGTGGAGKAAQGTGTKKPAAAPAHGGGARRPAAGAKKPAAARRGARKGAAKRPARAGAKKPAAGTGAKKPAAARRGARKGAAKRPARAGAKKARGGARRARRRRPKRVREEEAEITDEEQLEEGITDEEIANFQVGKANMEQLINRVCEMLSSGPSGGTLQGDVWRRLKLTLSDGFRLALKLEWLGLITREKVLENGRWTYRLILKRTPISTRSIVSAPCLTCSVEQKCTPDGEISPHTCDLIRDWVLADAKRARRRR